MPYKDCTFAEPTCEWSPQRCKGLGGALLSALLHVHPYVHDEVALMTLPLPDPARPEMFWRRKGAEKGGGEEKAQEGGEGRAEGGVTAVGAALMMKQ